MIPFAHETVTLMHKEGTGYKRHVLSGCSWRQTMVKRMDGNSSEKTLETVCRIPAGKTEPVTGDLLIRGEIKLSAGSEIELVRLMEQLRESGFDVFRVLLVKNNAVNSPLPHYAVSGE